MLATRVAPSRGQAGCEAASSAACARSMPCCKRVEMPSATTIALSTIMPRAMTRAPSDTRCKSMAMPFITMNVPRMVMIRAQPMTRPIRHPMVRASTTRTMITASARLITNAPIDSRTRSDCQVNFSTPIPTGNCGRSSSRRSSRPAPVSTILPPAMFAT